MADDQLTEAGGSKGPEAEPGKGDPGLGGGKQAAGMGLIFAVLFVVLLVALSYWLRGGLGEVEVHPEYLILALVGVVFHIASKIREVRDEEAFNWKEYGPDYLFRAFQACVYVVLIQNLVGSDAPWNMALIALFVGMYIRKVEKAFGSLGDRFGDMLAGVLGTAVQRLSPAERRKKLEELQKQLLDLKDKYSAKKTELKQVDQQNLDAQFLKIKELLQKGKIDAVEMKLLDLEFRLKELGAA